MSILIEVVKDSNRYQIEKIIRRKVIGTKIEVLTSYRLLCQSIPDERSVLRPIAHSNRAEVLLSKLADMISSGRLNEFLD